VKLLVDTHIFFWALMDVPRPSPTVTAALADGNNQDLVSIASACEMAIEVGLGKWLEAAVLLSKFEAQVARANFAILPVTLDHVRTAGLMQAAHRDPFDRLLAAQAQIENLTLVSTDPKLTGLGAPILS
jgi:PIN domain nuclease of toxin-antitoxin system